MRKSPKRKNGAKNEQQRDKWILDPSAGMSAVTRREEAGVHAADGRVGGYPTTQGARDLRFEKAFSRSREAGQCGRYCIFLDNFSSSGKCERRLLFLSHDCSYFSPLAVIASCFAPSSWITSSGRAWSNDGLASIWLCTDGIDTTGQTGRLFNKTIIFFSQGHHKNRI